MSIDAIACEPQFLDHLAPVWRALPVRGTFHVDQRFADRATFPVEPLDSDAVRRSMRMPEARIEDGPACLVASYGDIKVARRLGYRRFAFLEHGIGQSYTPVGRKGHGSYAGGVDRDDCGLFLVPNEYAAEHWRRAYPGARVEVVGSPRLDDLPARGPGDGPVVAVSFHWPAYVHPYAGNAYGDFHRSLRALAERFRVIGHAHPKGDWPDRMARFYRRAGIEFVRDFDEVCRRADVYVCDNSSTIFEFASTGRPVVLMNARNWTRKVSLGLRFWDAAHVGRNVDAAGDERVTTSSLLRAVEGALANDDAAMRDHALSVVYAHRTGAAERAAAAIREWLGYATGGPVEPGQPYLVGERGPELFYPGEGRVDAA